MRSVKLSETHDSGYEGVRRNDTSGSTIRCSVVGLSDPTNHQFSVLECIDIANVGLGENPGLPEAESYLFSLHMNRLSGQWLRTHRCVLSLNQVPNVATLTKKT